MRSGWVAVGGALAIGVVAIVVTASDGGEAEQDPEPIGDFCTAVSQLSIDAAVAGDEPFSTENLTALATLAPDQQVRASIDDALDKREVLDELEDISLTRTEEEDQEAQLLEVSLTADLAPIGIYLAENCQSEIEAATKAAVEFDTPPEVGASSDPVDLRELPDVHLGEVNLSSEAAPTIYDVSYRGGVTCVVTEEGSEICYPVRRTDQDRMMELTFSIDVMSGFAPGTTGDEIVFRDANGFEFSGEMLTPHLFRVHVPVQAVGPYVVRAGTYACLGYGSITTDARCLDTRS